MSESCANCRFFRPFKMQGNEGHGECHRHAPRNGTFKPFPDIPADEWCGEWQPIPQRHNDRPEQGGKT